MKRTLITNQTLEPTQVAGFNQFYDDFNGTEAWRSGVAVDQKFSKNLFGGVEYSERDLTVPAVDAVSGDSIEVDWIEKLFRAYFFWTPHPWVGIRAEYQYEKFKSDGRTDLPERVTTHRVPLSLSFFHPSGLSASLTTTYYDQDGKFVRLDGSVEKGDDTFWLVDAAVRYRFPKRYGFLTVGVAKPDRPAFQLL